MNFFTGNSLWNLIAQSDTTSKLVLLTLLAMSIVCWTVFFGKLIIFRLKNKQFNAANKKLSHAQNITQLTEIANNLKNTAPGYFLLKNLTFVQEATQANFDHTISDNDWILIEKNNDNMLETMMIHNETYLSILSSSAAVAPLLGLFGTVWGLVHAFMRISETQVADIATIAPGIAEALITTLAGLIVAIPALVMFNYLQTRMRRLEHNLITLADRMMFIVQKQKRN
jgi:biopolymer transport protein TolQ